MSNLIEHEGFEEVRAINRRRRMRIALPIAVVMVMLLALLGIALYDYKMMRADALALSKGVIINLQSRIETEVAAYLRPIPGIIRLSRSLLADKITQGINRDLAELLGIGMLENAPQLTSLIVGSNDGEFFMVRRFQDGNTQGLETKIIQQSKDASADPQVDLTRRGSNGQVLSSGPAPWDGYDPRKRPWFKGADELRALHWTDVYPFFSDQAAGITASIPFVDQDGNLRAVFGADVTLDSLSRFLRTLTIGKSGIALIVDDQGRVIAHPKAELIQKNSEGQLHLTQIGDLKDAIISRAFDKFRVEGHGRRDFDLKGKRYISSVSSLNHLLQRDWSILVVVPEEDFVGFVVENVSKTLVMGVSVIALAALLAGFLIRQGLRADRDAINILGRQAQLDAQSEAFGKIAVQSALFGAQDPDALAPVTEAVAQATGVRRAGIWQLDAKADTLGCIDCYDQETEGHTQGARLSRSEHPELFKVLEERATLTSADALQDLRLSSLYHHYLAALGCRAFVSVPIVVADRVTGSVWLEDSRTRSEWPREIVSFAQAIANLMAIRDAVGETPPLSQNELHDQAGPQIDEISPAVKRIPELEQEDVDTSLGALRAAAFTARLADRAQTAGSARAEVIDRLAVLSLLFTDAIALAEPVNEEAERTTVACLMEELEAAAAECGVGYLKFLSDQVIASIDPAEEAGQGLELLTGFALTVQGICERLLTEQDSPLSFRIGIDLGPVIGSVVGSDRTSFNLWGEAVQMATRMADTSLPGAIQTTETVYLALNRSFLFQLRGHHYLEGVGEFSTYLLSGRL